MNIEFSTLEGLAEEVQGKAYVNYSGRYMHGKTCVGIILDSEADLLELGAAIIGTINDEDLQEALVKGYRQLDSMGHDIIVYWPTIQCEDAPEDYDKEDDEDEDED